MNRQITGPSTPHDLDEVVGKKWLGVYDAVNGIKWDFADYMDLKQFVKQILFGYQPILVTTFSSDVFPGWIQGLKDYAGAVPPLYARMVASRDPAFQLCGKAGEVWCDMIARGIPLGDSEKQFQPVADYAERLIADKTTTPETRSRIYIVWELAIDLFLGEDAYVNRYNLQPQHDRAMGVLQSFRKSRDEDLKPPVNQKPTTMPWARADRVCELKKTPGLEMIDQLIHPLAGDGFVWAIGIGSDGDNPFTQLLCLPLVEGSARKLARLDGAWTLPPHMVDIRSRAAISDRCYWLATRDAGILAFPLDGSPAFFVDASKGFPSNHVESIACCDGIIFAGLADGGYIVRYDPKTSHCQVLASSRRKDKRSGLDDCLAYESPCMVADSARHRVLFYTYQVNGRPSGIWQINAAGEISELYETRNVGNSAWCSQADGGHVLFTGNSWVLDLDLQTDRPTVLWNHKNWPAGPKIPSKARGNTASFAPLPPLLHRDGYLWSGDNFTRTEIETGRVQDLPNVEHDRVNPTEVFQLFDDGRHALMGDQRTLWQLTFNASKPPTTQP